jgi:hypothetical protein
MHPSPFRHGAVSDPSPRTYVLVLEWTHIASCFPDTVRVLTLDAEALPRRVMLDARVGGRGHWRLVAHADSIRHSLARHEWSS